MRASARQIIGLPVETRHGSLLGKVADIAIDIENSVVVQYKIAPASLVKKIISPESELLITPEQVVSITKTKMVVVDLETSQTVDAGEVFSFDNKATTQAKKARGISTSVRQ